MNDAAQAPQAKPILTWILIAGLALVYAFEIPFGGAASLAQVSPVMLNDLGAISREAIDRGELYRIFIAPFLHANILHLISNMVALTFLGALIELWFGRSALLSIFALGGFSGAAASCFFNQPNAISVGASGAIMALGLFAFITAPKSENPAEQNYQRFKIMIWLAPSILPLFPLEAIGMHAIDHAAHAGGAAFGAFAGLVFVLLSQSLSGLKCIHASFVIVSCALMFGAALSSPAIYELWRNAMLSVRQLNDARAFSKKLNYESAAETYRSLIERKPTEALYHIELAQTLTKQSNYNEALKEFIKAAKLQSGVAPLIFNDGVSLLKLGEPQHAENYFRAAAYLDSSIIQAWENLSASLLLQSNYAVAAEELEKGLKVNKKSGALYRRYGQVLLRLNNPKRALEALQLAMDTGDKATELYFYFAEAKRLTGDIVGSQDSYRSFVALAGRNKAFSAQVEEAQKWLPGARKGKGSRAIVVPDPAVSNEGVYSEF